MTRAPIRRTGVIRSRHNAPRMLFIYIDPTIGATAIIDAESIEDAWIIATGWEDQAGIEQRKRQGWKLLPCMVEWNK